MSEAEAGASEERPARLPGLDALKGLAILGVVAIHAAPLAPESYLDHFVGGVARLAVPLFLIVTGFLHGRRGLARDPLRRYFFTFLRLHLLYGAFYWGLEIVLRGMPEHVSLKWALLHFGAGSYAGQFYLAVLLQVLFLAGFLLPVRFWRSAAALLLSVASALAGILTLYAASSAEEPAGILGLIGRLRGNPVWLWLVYFHVGAWVGVRADGGKLASLGAVSGAAVFAALAFAASGLPMATTPDFVAGYPYARLSVLLGGIALALAVPALATLRAPLALRRLGRESFPIYVLNPAILVVLVEIVGQAANPFTSWLRVGTTVLVALAAARLLRRFAPVFLP